MEYQLTNNRLLKIIKDENALNPRENEDCVSKIICFHKRYAIGDKHNYKHEDYSCWRDMEYSLTLCEDAKIILPIYLMDHGDQSISLSPYGCKWDSGQVGFILMSKKTINKEWGGDAFRAKRCLLAEFETYQNYFEGENYGFQVIDKNGDEEDSCWGFYGRAIFKSGIIEHLPKADQIFLAEQIFEKEKRLVESMTNEEREELWKLLKSSNVCSNINYLIPQKKLAKLRFSKFCQKQKGTNCLIEAASQILR